MRTLADLVRDGRAVLMGAIRQELLSGIELAAQFFNTCRSQGVLGFNTDFLICAVSKIHDLPILSLDNDFAHYKEILTIQRFAD